MSDRIKYLEAEILDIDVPNEVVVDEDKMDPNSGHIDIPENNASEVADAGIDVNVENKAEDCFGGLGRVFLVIINYCLTFKYI